MPDNLICPSCHCDYEGAPCICLRGADIKATATHDAGAYARCSYCKRYSDHPDSLNRHFYPCDCGKISGWSGSFLPPDSTSTWSDAS